MVTAAVMTLPASLNAKPNNSELNCVFDHAARRDIEAAWSAQHEHRTPTANESAAMDRIAEVTGACLAQYHWTRARGATAITYAFARVNLDDALRELAERGVPPILYERIAADLGERGRAALENGDTSNGNFEFIGQTVARDLSDARVPVQSGSPELIEIARTLAHALSAQSGIDRASEAFSTP
jgi:hypothetical protein